MLNLHKQVWTILSCGCNNFSRLSLRSKSNALPGKQITHEINVFEEIVLFSEICKFLLNTRLILTTFLKWTLPWNVWNTCINNIWHLSTCWNITWHNHFAAKQFTPHQCTCSWYPGFQELQIVPWSVESAKPFPCLHAQVFGHSNWGA